MTARVDVGLDLGLECVFVPTTCLILPIMLIARLPAAAGGSRRFETLDYP